MSINHQPGTLNQLSQEVEWTSPDAWAGLLDSAVDADEVRAAAVFSRFLASKGVFINAVRRGPATEPLSDLEVREGAQALKGAHSKRKLVEVSDLEEELEDEVEKQPAAKKIKEESSLKLIERVMVLLRHTDPPVDRIDYMGDSAFERAIREKAKRVFNVNTVPSDLVVTASTLGDDGWMGAKAGVPGPKRRHVSTAVAKIGLATADRLHTLSLPGRCEKVEVNWQTGPASSKHATVWLWTGVGLATRAVLSREMDASEISQIKTCKACMKLSFKLCGCSVALPLLPQ